MIRHQVGLIGTFTSVPSEPSVPSLMFLPNPEFRTFISSFQNNLLRSYIAEYYLELSFLLRRLREVVPVILLALASAPAR
jgi:hypothetical protein